MSKISAWVAPAAKEKFVRQELDLGALGPDEVEVQVEHTAGCVIPISRCSTTNGACRNIRLCSDMKSSARLWKWAQPPEASKLDSAWVSAGTPAAACTAGSAFRAITSSAWKLSRRLSVTAEALRAE